MSAIANTGSRCICASNKPADKASLARLLKAKPHGTEQLVQKLTRQENNLKKEIEKLVDAPPEITAALVCSEAREREEAEMAGLAASNASSNGSNATTRLRNERKRERLADLKAKNTASVHRIIAKAAKAGGVALKESRVRKKEELERRHNRKLLSTNFVRQNMSSRGGRVGKKRKRRVSAKKAPVVYTSHRCAEIGADTAHRMKRGKLHNATHAHKHTRTR